MNDLRRSLKWLREHWLTTIVVVVFAAIVGVSGFLLWDWFDVEKVKAIAAIVQAFGVVIAAVLTYRYAKKLEGHKFKMRLQEIAHANTHKRRMESLENISKAMGTVISKLGTVPPFIPELDPVLPQAEGAKPEESFSGHRFCIKIDRFNEAILSMIEAVEQGNLYIENSVADQLETFRVTAVGILEAYFTERSNPKQWGVEILNFKASLKNLKSLRKTIEDDFKGQLQNPPDWG